MTGEITSGRAGEILAPSLRGQWARLFAFLRRPALPERFASAAVSARIVGRLYLLDLAFILAFGLALISAEAAGIAFPQNLNSTLELNAGTILLFVVIAPVLEEVAFRSWLSGRPGTIVALLWVAAGVGVLVLSGPGEGLAGPIAAFACLVLAIALLVLLRKAPRLPMFERRFGWFFWASAIAFALVHLVNYEEGALVILLPLLVPQFVLGTMAGYVRVQCGLAWSILLHAAHNGFAVGMALLALSLAPGG
ncbi:CPBP family glutamic-type intramembrane protease [Erythrobacter sp.]|uniref:CPBP family glutamic-type intramembrane protease n=1 Tax=Erythrobacter sp. TaxID=1042 RepID=UPI001425D0CA|nr:CPBP family glutamic-type intramembrane protease [Erythrobacter sp.]QIQ87775.1 MAG: CPBP family intramembrane metalloprotease [Erythrobacter sp.]